MNTCAHKQNDRCAIASALAGQPVTPSEPACKHCAEKAEPARGINSVTVSLAVSQVAQCDAAAAKALLKQHGHLLTKHGVREPTWAQQAWSVGTAVADWLADGARSVPSDVYQSRLVCCDACPLRSGHRCSICKCFVRAKAAMPNQRCPAPTPLWDTWESHDGLTAGPPGRAEAARQKLILKCKLCPGDLLTMTAALQALHTTYPGEYVTDVRTPHAGIWTANPWVTKIADGDKTARIIEMHYPSVHRCNQENAPFLAGYTEHLGEQIGRPLRLRTNRPHLFLTAGERSAPRRQLWDGAPNLEKPFWIVNAGIKRDFTAKAWPLEYYQEVIDRTKDRITWVQIGLKKDMHRSLRGVVNLVDAGGPPLRETILLAHHAAGGLGPVTFLQHLLAAWEKPYLCVAGGREPATWIQYPLQHTFHTVGQLDCCRPKSCWKARVVPLGDNNEKDKNLCLHPVTDLERPAPKCLTLIKPGEVLQVLHRHLAAGG